MKPILEVTDLHVRYGKVEAVHGVTLSVNAGHIVSMIGPNGAGKSTTLNAIMGTISTVGSSTGTVSFMGEDLSGVPVEERVMRGMSLVPETRELFSSMTVEDNLQLGAYSRKKMGDRQMLALGRALMAKPKLLMLDEPSLGLAPLIVKEIFHIISNLRNTGVALLLIEQNARAALQVSDYGYVLETGNLSMQGPADDLASDPQVIETYLGFSKKAVA